MTSDVTLWTQNYVTSQKMEYLRRFFLYTFVICITFCVKKVITFCVGKLLHFALIILLLFASILLHFVSVLHFAAIVITFCVSITFFGDYYILRRNGAIF